MAKLKSSTTEDLIGEKYRGIRPAAGYPACPDHTEKGILWKLLDVEKNAGIKLTESFAMWPGSSVSGLYFAHPESKYFAVGKLGRDQLLDYHVRKGMTLQEAERWLGPYLNYDPVKRPPSLPVAAGKPIDLSSKQWDLFFSGCRPKFIGMKHDVVPVQIRGILPANSGCALFVGNDEKVFVINVEPQMGAVIGMFLRQTPKERPLTHDLINRIFQGFGINVERVIITDLKNSTYFARLILQQQNELARKIVEMDARPSDCLAIAAAQKKPIFVAARFLSRSRT